MDCSELSLFKLFDDKEWAVVNSSNNAAALTNIEYVDSFSVWF